MNRREGSPRRQGRDYKADLWKEFDQAEAWNEFQKNPLPVPEVNDVIYVPGSGSMLLGAGKIGGLATVTQVIERIDERSHHLLRVREHSLEYYEWEGRKGIGWRQGLFAREYTGRQAGLRKTSF